MKNDGESKFPEATGILTEGDKVAFNISAERIGELLKKDFEAAKERLHDRGFPDKFIWHYIKRGEAPSRDAIRNHLSLFDIDFNEKFPEILYKHVRRIFFYLIHVIRAITIIHREDDAFSQEMGSLYVDIPETFKDNRENYFFQGYVVGKASKWINDPDKLAAAIQDRKSRQASKAGKGKKGVITSPATKAILLALDYGFLTGKKVRQFFDENMILDEIEVDIETIETEEGRKYRFFGNIY